MRKVNFLAVIGSFVCMAQSVSANPANQFSGIRPTQEGKYLACDLVTNIDHAHLVKQTLWLPLKADGSGSGVFQFPGGVYNTMDPAGVFVFSASIQPSGNTSLVFGASDPDAFNSTPTLGATSPSSDSPSLSASKPDGLFTSRDGNSSVYVIIADCKSMVQ